MLPDNETIQSTVRGFAEEARSQAEQPTPVELPKGETATRVFPGVVAPIYMGKETDTIPERYVIHYSFVQCKNCGAATRASEFYQLSYLRSRVNGKRVRHLTKCTSARYNIPVDKILTGCSTVPYCQECDKIDLSHLPPPPASDNLYDLAEPRFKGQAAPTTSKPAASPKPASKKPTLDDLI